MRGWHTQNPTTKYWPWQDSNLQSPDPKSGALSIRPHGLSYLRESEEWGLTSTVTTCRARIWRGHGVDLRLKLGLFHEDFKWSMTKISIWTSKGHDCASTCSLSALKSALWYHSLVSFSGVTLWCHSLSQLDICTIEMVVGPLHKATAKQSVKNEINLPIF